MHIGVFVFHYKTHLDYLISSAALSVSTNTNWDWGRGGSVVFRSDTNVRFMSGGSNVRFLLGADHKLTVAPTQTNHKWISFSFQGLVKQQDG